MGQYTSNPLVLEQTRAPELQVVANRASAFLGVSADLSRRFGLRAHLPLTHQWGADPTPYASDGPGLGDLEVAGRVLLVQVGRVGTGAVLGIFMAEAAIRTLNEMATFAEAGVSESEGDESGN